MKPRIIHPNTRYCHTSCPIIIQEVYLCFMFNIMHPLPAPVVLFASRTLVSDPQICPDFSQFRPPEYHFMPSPVRHNYSPYDSENRGIYESLLCLCSSLTFFWKNRFYACILRRNWYTRSYFWPCLCIKPGTVHSNTRYCYTSRPIIVQEVYLWFMFNIMHLLKAPVVHFASRTAIPIPQ